MEAIPLAQIPSQRLQVVLDGQNCTVRVYWRQKKLYLDLSVGTTVICKGAMCQNRADVLQSKSIDFSGTLHFYDREGDEAPEWDDLWNGTTGRWVLFYATADEELPEELQF